MAKNSMLIIVPVLNEANNIFPLLKKIFKYLKNKKKHILFIDDNSTDGTRNKIIQAKKKYKKIYLIKRSRKLGIGSAHKIGLAWGFKNKYKIPAATNASTGAQVIAIILLATPVISI